MGTNYYLKKPQIEPCPHCGRGGEAPGRGLHIGKSSAGWAFSLRIYPASEHANGPLVELTRLDATCVVTTIDELAHWIPLFDRFGVIDEYECDVGLDNMIATIIERAHPSGLHYRPAHKQPGYHVVGKGLGTYDLIIGEFS